MVPGSSIVGIPFGPPWHGEPPPPQEPATQKRDGVNGEMVTLWAAVVTVAQLAFEPVPFSRTGSRTNV